MKTMKMTAWIAAGLAMSATLFTSCKKDDDTNSLPPIGGYNASNDVAATNLLAHWPFDGSNNERISNTATSAANNATFTTGASGARQALQLNGGYLRYPAIGAINTANGLANFTVSAWVKTKNNGSTSSEIFGLVSPDAEDWGQMINMMVETGQKKAASDTLIVKGLLGQYSSGKREGHDNVSSGDAADAGKTFNVVKSADKWMHMVLKYDASASVIQIYVNNALVSNTKYEKRADGKLGALVFPTPQQVIIGAFPNASTGFAKSSNQTWQGLFNGSIDELRIYNKTLTTAEVGALYQLEAAGR